MFNEGLNLEVLGLEIGVFGVTDEMFDYRESVEFKLYRYLLDY